MTLQDLVENYKHVQEALDKKYPISDKEKRIFARITKMVEEFGELAEVSLAKANLQRESKNLHDVERKIEDEFADVVSTLLLLGIELDIDIEGAIQRKITFTNERLNIPKSN